MPKNIKRSLKSQKKPSVILPPEGGIFLSKEAAQFKGPKRFQIEHKQKIEALSDLKMKTRKNLSDLKKMEMAYGIGTLQMTKEKHKEFYLLNQHIERY